MKAEKGSKLEAEEASRWWKLEEHGSSQRLEVSAEEGPWSLRRKERKGWSRRGTFGSRAGEAEEESSPLHNCVPAPVFAFKLLHFKQFRPNCFFFHSPTQPLVTSLVAVSMRKDFHAPEKPSLSEAGDFCEGLAPLLSIRFNIHLRIS